MDLLIIFLIIDLIYWILRIISICLLQWLVLPNVQWFTKISLKFYGDGGLLNIVGSINEGAHILGSGMSKVKVQIWKLGVCQLPLWMKSLYFTILYHPLCVEALLMNGFIVLEIKSTDLAVWTSQHEDRRTYYCKYLLYECENYEESKRCCMSAMAGLEIGSNYSLPVQVPLFFNGNPNVCKCVVW